MFVFLLLLLYGMSLMCVGLEQCMVKFEIPMCYPANNTAERYKKLCRTNEVCKKTFNITYMKLQPYNTLLIEDLLHTCCGKCTHLNTVKTFHNITQITDQSVATSHFIFPILGRYAEKSLYGYHYIPLVKVPSLFYVTAKADNVLDQVLTSCINMWPLIIILIMMVAISGFIGWVLETGVNKDEFPRIFIVGWFEGFWWSFISMTTVGYGDKTPKSIAGRLFCIGWILIGLTTFSMLTGKLTFEIYIANSPLPPDLLEARVGALRHRTYDALHVAARGGILIDVKEDNDTSAIFKLISLLRHKELDGFILDRYTYITFGSYIESMTTINEDQKKNIEFLQKKTIQTEEIYRGEQLTYGILVKHFEDYMFFADFIKDNWEVLNTCDGLNINELANHVKIEKEYTALFDTSAGFFWPSLIFSGSIIVIICFFGVAYEHIREKSDDYSIGSSNNNVENSIAF